KLINGGGVGRRVWRWRVIMRRSVRRSPLSLSDRPKLVRSVEAIMLAGSETQTLIREAQLVVREVRARSGLAQAWELLQERDADGKATGALPYTDAALAALDTAQANAPDDIGLLHHAAIAHHARAWDFELRTDPRAAAEWALALHLWYRLVTSQEFRTGLE